MVEKRFFQGFGIALAVLGSLALAAHMLLAKVGEIGIDGVIDHQLAAPAGTVLFSSAINQQAYPYKTRLYDRVRPDVVAIGSSRAMQVQASFFRHSFVNMGGASNNVAELEKVVDYIADHGHPQLAVLFVDQWWVNARYPEASAPAQISAFPRIVSADLLNHSLWALHRGNWIARSFHSRDLGIYALLNEEGFSRDGSFEYVGTVTGEHASLDPRFSDTLARIAEDRSRMQKAASSSPELVSRMCRVIGRLQRTAGHVVVVLPPFANAVWQRMENNGYQYMDGIAERLRQCSPQTPVVDFTRPAAVSGATDCEFVDGLHGGSVVYARMLAQIGRQDPAVSRYLDGQFVQSFIAQRSGTSGTSLEGRKPGRAEVDFLKLGCMKAGHGGIRAP